MDKQDQLAAVILAGLREPLALESGSIPTPNQIRAVAVSVRSFMGSAEVVERVSGGVREYFADRTGFGTNEGEGVVAAYYGGNWITLNTNEIARAALSAALGPDIGGGRG